MVFLLLTLNIFHNFFHISIVDFEQIFINDSDSYEKDFQEIKT